MRHIIRDHCSPTPPSAPDSVDTFLGEIVTLLTRIARVWEIISLSLFPCFRKGLHHPRIDCYLKPKKKECTIPCENESQWFSNINFCTKNISLLLGFPFVFHIVYLSSLTLFSMIATSHMWRIAFNLNENENSVFLLHELLLSCSIVTCDQKPLY